MDGFKKRLNASLQFKLSLMLSLAILLVAVVAGVFSFMSAFDEAQELQDDELRQVAQLMDRQSLLPPATDFHADEEVPRVVVQRLGDGGPLALPASLAEGMHTLVLDGETYRVLVRTRASGDRIAVAQESDLRDEIAREGALRTVMPFLILVPVLLLIVADLVRKMFRPMVALAQEIDLRAGQDLHPVDNSRLPAEVRPFAVAINRLLARVEQAMEGQRRFVADAAHELRSPLAALSLQAERLAQVDMSEVAQERLAMLRRGIARGSSLLDQLLSLARAQQAGETPDSTFSVLAVYRRVLEDLMPLAEAKGIDIGLESSRDIHLWVSEVDLLAIVRNLVDNAIRYTPEGGRIDLSLDMVDGAALLRVQDNGPGIPTSERGRVFDAFYRVLGSDQIGSGLGLSIVQAIAQRIGADIQLGFSDDLNQIGLSVTVRIPMDA